MIRADNIKLLMDAKKQVEDDAIVLAALVFHGKGKDCEKIRLANRILGNYIAINAIMNENNEERREELPPEDLTWRRK